ncbi:hypothetical protein [Streptomyces boninensis]|uniref:hypothetical protein n=1 Tax=Streptomyces boninensis TaxID=2039455 RepID=UPI003B219F65
MRRIALALMLCCALLAGGTACSNSPDREAGAGSANSTSKPEREKYNRAKFVANAGLAAGAAYQWLIKPYRADKFQKGAKGRTFTLIKAGVAGAFAYNRLKAAQKNAKGDPVLTKALAPVTGSIESLKGMTSKFRKGNATEADVKQYEDVLNNIKGAGKDAGLNVVNRVPTTSQLNGG